MSSTRAPWFISRIRSCDEIAANAGGAQARFVGDHDDQREHGGAREQRVMGHVFDESFHGDWVGPGAEKGSAL